MSANLVNLVGVLESKSNPKPFGDDGGSVINCKIQVKGFEKPDARCSEMLEGRK